jgi:hypothetical protein
LQDSLNQQGFVQVGTRWGHPIHAVSVWDVERPGNAILMDRGQVVPVDLQLERANSLRSPHGYVIGARNSSAPAATAWR